MKCGNPECKTEPKPKIRIKYCCDKCRARARYLRDREKKAVKYDSR